MVQAKLHPPLPAKSNNNWLFNPKQPVFTANLGTEKWWNCESRPMITRSVTAGFAIKSMFNCEISVSIVKFGVSLLNIL